jgi:hypothetical protein
LLHCWGQSFQFHFSRRIEPAIREIRFRREKMKFEGLTRGLWIGKTITVGFG